MKRHRQSLYIATKSGRVEQTTTEIDALVWEGLVFRRINQSAQVNAPAIKRRTTKVGG